MFYLVFPQAGIYKLLTPCSIDDGHMVVLVLVLDTQIKDTHTKTHTQKAMPNDATHDGTFSYSSTLFIAAIVIRNISLIILTHISHKSL